MFQKSVLVLGIILLTACGAARGPSATSADTRAVSQSFMASWCDQEAKLSPELYRTVGMMIHSVGASSCYEAADALSKLTELTLNGGTREFVLTDLRPIMTLKGLKSLKLIRLGISDIQNLMFLQTLPRLEELDLSFNTIKSLQGLSSYTRGLKKLVANDNGLVDADGNTLFSEKDMEIWTHLSHVVLQRSTLTRVPFFLPKAIEVLDLTGNVLSMDWFKTLAPRPEKSGPLYPALNTILVVGAFTQPSAEVGTSVLGAGGYYPSARIQIAPESVPVPVP